MAQQPIDKDKVRMMVADLGYSETSQRTGIKYGTLRKWACVGKWNKPIIHAQAVTTVTTPIADAHAEALAEHKQTTKFNLAKYSAEASRDASEHPNKLGIAQEVRHVAAVAASVWPEERQGETGLTLNLLNLVMPAESARRSAHEDE